MYIDVIVPVSVPNTYTYGVPVALQHDIAVGKRVEVEFGRRKRYAAIVVNIHNHRPAEYDAKPVLQVIDDEPILFQQQLDFWKWISQYYMANIGDVMATALPSALKLSSEASIQLVMDTEIEVNELTDDEYVLFEALSNKPELTIDEVQIILDKKTIYPTLNLLIQKGIIAMKETLKERYKPKVIAYLKLNEKFNNDVGLQTILDELERAPKQQALLLTYLHRSKHKAIWIEKSSLLKQADVSSAIAKAVIDKEILIEEHHEVDRIKDSADGDLGANLTALQSSALTATKTAFQHNKPVLIHGITGSGKTHIYIKLIEGVIATGKQCLYLLPEIALTSQIIKRLQAHFGAQVGVYHSKFTDAERVEIWNKTRNGTYKVVVGARSALFLPFSELNLVIVDEEHDTSYKQYNPSPRYHARDAALLLAHQIKANIVLGSATPSFESYFNAQQGKYELVELKERFGNIALPEIEIVNLYKQNIPGKTYQKFSKRLIDELRESVANNKQAILFRNRRGYSSFVQCKTCGHSIRCVNCDVTLTYHKFRDQLECHYCGYTQNIPYRCIACGSEDLEKIGLGTEKIQEELQTFIPTATIGRMDLDTTRGKRSHERLIQQFENKEIDILVGTQMVTKGLHFNDVNLVGIINADAILKFPDFRASERAYQLMEQVGGRAGRTGEKGLVIVQVRDDTDPVLQFLTQHDYRGLFDTTLPERWKFKYPPYYRLIELTIKHKDWRTCLTAAQALANQIRGNTQQIVKGPSEPLIPKINNYFIQEILITIDKDQTVMQHTKQIIQEKIDWLMQQKGLSQVRVNIDVDPM